MIKEIRYTGVTATPSDYISPDGELDAAINLVPENGELVVEQGGEVKDTLGDGDEVVCVHDVNSGIKHLIIKNDNSLYYRLYGETEKTLIKTYESGAFKCSVMGNVLCVYGIGEIEHFIFLHGEYRQLSAGDYAIGVLFGLEATPRSKAVDITGLFTNANGASVSTWNNVHSQEYSTPAQKGVSLNCNLSAGKKYRFHMTITNGSYIEFYVKLTLYYTEEDYDFVPGPNTYYYFSRLNYQEFTPTKDVNRVYVSFAAKAYGIMGSQNPDESNWYPNVSDFSGVMTIDEQVTQIMPGATYLYNAVETVNNGLLGVANGLLAEIRNDNRFALPFFVRYGFRMIGGDIITVSPPILVEPNTEVTPVIEVNNISINQAGTYFSGQVTAKAYSCKLKYKVRDVERLRSLMEVDELIDSLVIAVSEPVYLYKQGATQAEIANSVYVTNTKPGNKCFAIDGIKDTAGTTAEAYLTLPHFEEDYETRLISSAASVFKIISEIKKNDILLEDNFVDVPLDDGVLNGMSGITGEEYMLPDNVENLSTYDAKYVMSYNQREHMLGVFDCMFKGFDLDVMCGYIKGTEHATNYKVGCRMRESDDLQYLVRGKRQESSLNRRWLYYPSEKAEEAVIYENGTCATLQLFKHPFLKGSYRLNETAYTTSQDSSGGVDALTQLISEGNPNKVYVSIQGNPLVIEQILSVGDGQLLAATSNTVALAQEQFGNSPIYIFSTEGVWVIEVSSDGKYSSRKPVSRDVCINLDSIVQIDNAVLFITDRGIMLLSGSDGICISEAIDSPAAFTTDILPKLGNLPHGAVGIASDMVPFREFLKQSKMLYDYNNQRIIVYNPEQIYAYVYSLKSKQWGMMESNIKYGINSYPECLAVDDENNIVNMSKVELEEGTKDCLIISRPLKLDDGDLLKTIDTIITRGKFRKGAVKTILYGSRDLFSWHLVASSVDHYLRGFRGTPYKYFRIVLACDLQKDESIFGSTIQYTPRLVDKIR